MMNFKKMGQNRELSSLFLQILYRNSKNLPVNQMCLNGNIFELSYPINIYVKRISSSIYNSDVPPDIFLPVPSSNTTATLSPLYP